MYQNNRTKLITFFTFVSVIACNKSNQEPQTVSLGYPQFDTVNVIMLSGLYNYSSISSFSIHEETIGHDSVLESYFIGDESSNSYPTKYVHTIDYSGTANILHTESIIEKVGNYVYYSLDSSALSKLIFTDIEQQTGIDTIRVREFILAHRALIGVYWDSVAMGSISDSTLTLTYNTAISRITQSQTYYSAQF